MNGSMESDESNRSDESEDRGIVRASLKTREKFSRSHANEELGQG